MSLAELKEIVRDFIGRAKTRAAIEEIFNWAQANHQEQLKDDISLLKKGLVDLERKKRLGLLSNSEANIEGNIITHNVLNLLSHENEKKPKHFTPPHKKPSSPAMLKILMLTANPATTTKLNLDKEHSTITQKLQQEQAFFNIILRKAVSDSEFKEFTQQEQPSILHFSGHGQHTGISVQNDDKNGAILIPTSGLKSLFKFFKKKFKIEVVLLNACYTLTQAATIAAYVDYVIGTTVGLQDEAAIAFSSGFYYQLAENRSLDIEDAFDSGRTAAVMRGAKEEDFVIYRKGVLIDVA